MCVCYIQIKIYALVTDNDCNLILVEFILQDFCMKSRLFTIWDYFYGFCECLDTRLNILCKLCMDALHAQKPEADISTISTDIRFGIIKKVSV